MILITIGSLLSILVPVIFYKYIFKGDGTMTIASS